MVRMNQPFVGGDIFWIDSVGNIWIINDYKTIGGILIPRFFLRMQTTQVGCNIFVYRWDDHYMW